jgi:hypothetical protein
MATQQAQANVEVHRRRGGRGPGWAVAAAAAEAALNAATPYDAAAAARLSAQVAAMEAERRAILGSVWGGLDSNPSAAGMFARRGRLSPAQREAMLRYYHLT